ncbi:MAG: hypothetical protein IAF38_00100 [Bacteroidia bacterium]|nr:hypothetical protein [Bacteroidia bacterium]
MNIRLHLTEIQKPRVQAINLKYAKLVQKEVIEPELSEVSKYFKFMKIDSRKSEELKKILMPEQFKQYEKMKEEAIKKIMSEKLR